MDGREKPKSSPNGRIDVPIEVPNEPKLLEPRVALW